MEASEIIELVTKTADITARRFAEQTGQAKMIITIAEIKRLYGREIAKQSIAAGSGIRWLLTNKKGEKHCKRSDFDRFLMRTDRYNII